jgi:voltage-gated potassium channel
MTSDQRGDSPHAKERRFDELPQRRRRQLLIIAAIRSLASVTVLLTAYFLLPFTHLSSDSSIAQFAVGILIVIVVLSAQTVATLRADYPVLRAVESLATSVPLFLVVFATTHYVINWDHPGSYTEPTTRLDALYYTITTFTTVGFGDITPVSEPARLVTLLQMIGGVILIGIVARELIGAARLRQQGRSS